MRKIVKSKALINIIFIILFTLSMILAVIRGKSVSLLTFVLVCLVLISREIASILEKVNMQESNEEREINR